MRAYYFTSAEFALSNLVNKRIKISLLNELNDPYEFLGIDLSDKEFRRAFQAGRDEAEKMSGVICFSKSWKNPLMWAHYANKHTGMCLGFDVPDEHIIEVEYVSNLLKPVINMNLKYGGLEESYFKKVFNLKFKDWKYEKEVRVLVPKEEKHPSGYYFMDFEGNIELKEIILGQRCTTTYEDVKNHLHTYKSQIILFKSRIAFTKYEVVRNKSVEKYVHGA
ncbi:DUF2971 domain-containing protein [Gammaproteobacteria bacterium]|nr:DUF2971 domain-containing protein [Gammaproteobacteria bacterium]